MKKLSILLLALQMSMLGIWRAEAQVNGNDLVRIEVRVQSDQDRKDIKGSSADTVTQNKVLAVALSGKPKNPETRTVHWTIYGRDLKDKDISQIDSGDFKVDLVQGVQKFETKKVSTTSTAAHTVVSGNGRSRGGSGSRGGRVSVKKVDGEGVKYAGYGVVVKDGDRVVGEAFDPAGLKAEATK